MQIAIQAKIEAISAETLTKVLNKSVLRLHKVCYLRGRQMENVLV
jgi:predicted ribonuclease YlaK